MHLYDAQSSRKLDQQIIERGVNPEQLIMRAAASIWNLSKNFTAPGNIWCLAGSGNNGGDAIGVSGLAKIENKTVTLITLQEPKGVSQNILRFIKLLNVKCIKSLPKLEEVSKDDLVIDGLIGTGLSRPLEPWLEDGIDWINKAKMIGAKVISIDVPSGMNSSEGVVKHKAVRADATAMCLSAKQGCYTGSAANYTGALHMMDLGIKKPQKYLSGTSYLLTKEVATPRTRSNISHKGNFGTVLILGGWDGMEGAGHLAAKAALKIGAGKVYLCGGNIKNQPPEAIYVRRNLDEFNSILEKSDCIVAGPGLGQNANDYLYAAWLSKKPLVLDADGLNWLSKTKPTQRKNFIGTPHPGEAKTLLHSSSTKRFNLLKRLQKQYGGEWVLKGAGTLVTNSTDIYVNHFAHSILATAGSGDVLAGMIGGLIAQRLERPALTAVWLQSEAARIFLDQGETTILAGELLQNFSEAFAQLENKE